MSEYGLEFDVEWSFEGLGLLSKASAENGETLVSFLIEEDADVGKEVEVVGIPRADKFKYDGLDGYSSWGFAAGCYDNSWHW